MRVFRCMRWMPTLAIVLALVLAADFRKTSAADPVRPDAPGDDAAPTAEQLKFFESNIRPLLVEKCFKCHGAEKQSGSLRLDSRAGFLHGGDSGPALVAGSPDESLLIEAIKYESYEMPPDGKMSDAQIELLVRWVEMGAPWPKEDSPAPAVAEKRGITDADRDHWCFRPLQHPQAPALQGDTWSRNEIDRFLLARLREAKLSPQAETDRLTLIRRATQLVTGLPPTLAEIDAFLADQSPTAYESLVERLLESPRRGEHLARFWLDLVRFGESDGYRLDSIRPDAWRYRDYVIRAFNEDRPYNRFVMEQLAGDEIDPTNPDAIAATGYYRHGIYEYNNRDAETQWKTMLEDITDTTGDTFLAMGVGCAKCHDHKFDPILQTDYYQLQSFFVNLAFRDHQEVPPVDPTDEYYRKLAEWEDATREVRAELDEFEAPFRHKTSLKTVGMFPPEVQAMWHKPDAERTAYERQIAYLVDRQIEDGQGGKLENAFKGDDKTKREELLARLASFDHLKPQLPTYFAASDTGTQPVPLYVPGKPRLGEMNPAFLTVLGDEPPDVAPPAAAPQSTGRRTALAEWMVRPDHPLTTRVIVNRIWQQHFGTGIVASCSDFGRLGEEPTHPELLDWLATEFVAHGWSIKWLQREILLSAAFRQSSDPAAAPRSNQVSFTGVPAAESSAVDPQIVDPTNRLLWRFPVRRLQAEQIRDAMLAVSGELDLKAGGPSVSGETPRRSAYVLVRRNSRDELLAQFDFPDRITSTGERNITTTPTQSLLMINSDWTGKRAQALVNRLQKEVAGSTEARIRSAYRLAFGREPDAAELARARGFLDTRARRQQTQKDEALVVKQMPQTNSGAAEIRAGDALPPLRYPRANDLPSGDFTIEAVVMLDSLFADASVRTIAAHWDGDTQHPGWGLGVTSTKSRYKPRNLILQLVGKNPEGQTYYEVLPSNIHLELGRPYYVACSVRLMDSSESGVTFHVRDLTDPDAPLQSATVAHQVVAAYHQDSPLVIGGRSSGKGQVQAGHRWDGLIDEVRLTSGIVPRDHLLKASGTTVNEDDKLAGEKVVGHWTFDSARTFLADASGAGHTLDAGADLGSDNQPLIDFCHVLFNSNEFLYLD